jgi:tape measure domain-containing protein
MAKMQDLLVVIGLDGKSLNKLNKDLRGVKARFRNNLSEIQAMTQNAGRSLTMGLSAPLAGIGAAAVKSAIDLEKLETSFISLTGGAEQAANMMANLNDFTAKTPFQIEGVANAARQLIASGTGVDQVNNQLQFLGDIAATSGSEIQDIAAIFAKVNAKGKVELENLNQLAERGIPIFEALADATGLPANKLGAGAVPVKQFNQVLAGFAKEGGFAAGAMERLSETAAGKFSTALDNLKLAGAELAQTLMPTIKEIIGSVTRAAQRFTSLNESQKNTLLIVGSIAAAAGPLLLTVSALIKMRIAMASLNVVMAANPIGAVAVAVTLLIGSLEALKSMTKTTREETDTFIESTKELEKQQALLALNTKRRALETELASIRQAKAVSEAAASVGSLGDKFDKQIARRNVTRFDRQIQDLSDSILVLKKQAAEVEFGGIVISGAGGAGEDSSGGSKSRNAFKQTRKERERLENLTRQYIYTAKAEQEALEGVTRHYRELTGVLEDIEIDPEEIFEEFDESFFKLGRRLVRTRERAIEAAAGIKQAFTDTANSIAVSVGVGIGEALVRADNAFRSMGNTVLMTLASLAVQVGQMAIGIGLAVKGIKKALLSLSPVAAIAAGIALVALGSAAKAAMQNSINARAEAVPQMAEGGLFSGASLAMVGEGPGTSSINPEVVAPLDKLRNMMGGGNVNVTGTIRGRDLLLSEERSAYSRRRRFGN